MNKTVYHPVDLHIGNKLRKKRIEMGLKQEELGKAINISYQQVYKYERGFNRISCSKLYEIAKVLKIDINYFFYSLKTIDEWNYLSSGLRLSESHIKSEVKKLIDAFIVIEDVKIRASIINIIQRISHVN